MRKVRNIAIVVALMALLTAGCVSIPCAPEWDTATCKVQQAIAVAENVDLGLQTLKAGVPTLPVGVVAAIDAYHLALPAAKQGALDALAAYESGHGGNWQQALSFLINLYKDVNAVITGNGLPDQVKPAQSVVAKAFAAKGYK